MTPHVSIRTSTSTPYDGLNLASAYAAARLAAALSLAAVRGCNHRERESESIQLCNCRHNNALACGQRLQAPGPHEVIFVDEGRRLQHTPHYMISGRRSLGKTLTIASLQRAPAAAPPWLPCVGMGSPRRRDMGCYYLKAARQGGRLVALRPPQPTGAPRSAQRAGSRWTCSSRQIPPVRRRSECACAVMQDVRFPSAAWRGVRSSSAAELRAASRVACGADSRPSWCWWTFAQSAAWAGRRQACLSGGVCNRSQSHAGSSCISIRRAAAHDMDDQAEGCVDMAVPGIMHAEASVPMRTSGNVYRAAAA